MNSSSRGRARFFVRQHGLNIGSVALAALMAGCGGGGSSHNDPQSSQTPYRKIDASNAEAAVKLTLEMTDVTDALVSSWGLGSGINTSRCESGSGIGVVTNCVIGTNTFSGSVTTTSSQTQTVTVPGGSSRTVPTSLNLAITNLQWQSTNNRTTYTIDGNLNVTYAYPTTASVGSAGSVTGTLTLTDAATGKRYQYRSLSQRYTVSVNTTTFDYQFDEIDHKGSIVYLDENSQYVMQPGTLVDYLSLTANKSKLSLSKSVTIFPPSNDYSLRIDTDNDGNYDTFASIPVGELGMDHGSSENPLSVSISRQGGSGNAPIAKNQPVTLAASGKDSNHRFYQYSWTIDPAPGATGDNAATFLTAAQSTGIRSFASNIAGPYTMTVTATEVGVPAPASATASITVTVAHDLPQMSITNLTDAVGTVGAPVNFPITLQGGEGTISVKLLGAPAGMELDPNNDNLLIWNPQPQFFPGSSETVTLQVSNDDQSAVQSYTVTVNGAGSAPEITPGLAVNGFTTDASLVNVDGDASAELLIAGSGSAFFGLNLDGSDITTAIANPYALNSDAGNLLAVKQLKTNGVFNGSYAVATEKGIFIVDATTYAVRATRGLLFNVTSSTSKRRVAVADVDGDNTDEIIALTKTSNSITGDHLYVLKQDLTTLVETQTQPLGQQFLVGNVDADSTPEIVCGNGLVLNAATLATKYDVGARSNYVLANVDGDAQQEIVEVSASGFDVIDAETSPVGHTSIPMSLSLNNTNLFALDVIGSGKDQVLIGKSNNQVDVYSINKTAPSATPVLSNVGMAAANNAVTEVLRGDVISNGANVDELVIVSQNSGGGALISVAKLDGSLLVDGTTREVATGGFAAARMAAARAQNIAIDNDFFTASLLGSAGGGFIAGKGLLAVGTTGAPATVLTNISADTGLFAASGDIDGNSQQDFVISSKLRSDPNMSIMAQLTGVSATAPVFVTTGTPAPIAVGEISGSGNLDAVYIERSGIFSNEAVDLVVHAVGGSELAREPLQDDGLVLAAPVAVAVANLNGDAKPDIVLLDGAGLRTYEYSAGNLTLTGTVAVSGTPVALAIGDVDGDGHDEIAIASAGSSNTIQVYNLSSGSLALLVKTSVTTPTAGLTFYRAADARPLWLYGSANTVTALDASTLTQVWTSPALHGQINSIEVLATTLGNQLRVGSEGAIYRSQP